MQTLRLLLCFVATLGAIHAQLFDPARRQFESRCARCHGGDATGGESGPGILTQIAAGSDAQLAAFIREGSPSKGMPAFTLNDTEMKQLVVFLRSLAPISRNAPPAVVRRKIQINGGKAIEGQVLSEGIAELQLRTDDKQIHLLRKAGDGYREVTSQTDWTTYNGDVSGNRYSKLSQIDKGNVARLTPKWIFPIPNVS